MWIKRAHATEQPRQCQLVEHSLCANLLHDSVVLLWSVQRPFARVTPPQDPSLTKQGDQARGDCFDGEILSHSCVCLHTHARPQRNVVDQPAK